MQLQTTPSQIASNAMLRQAQIVPDLVPVSPTTLWRWVKAGNFPAPVKIGPNSTAWRTADVQNWLASR